MAFIDATDRRGVLIGPADGARSIFRSREHFRSGFYVGLHRHDGDESFEVRTGDVCFTIGTEQRVCGPDAIVFVPEGVKHGFLAQTPCVIDVFSEQNMGIYVTVLERDGTEREEEIFIKGFPSSHLPPTGESYTSRERIAALYASTRHLLDPLGSVA